MTFRLFSDRIFNRNLWRLTFPIAFQNLMFASVAAADAFMLGRVDQNSMAAVSLATQIQFVQIMVFCAITGGITILGAQYWGKRDVKTISSVFHLGLVASVVVSLVFFVGCVFTPRPLMLLFADEGPLVDIGVRYLRIAGISYLISGVSQCYLAEMKITYHVTEVACISSAAVVVNIIFNAVFIFGYCGAPAMGVAGAALATVIARVIELVWCIAASFRENHIRIECSKLFKFDRLLTKDFTRCALPILGACLFWGVGFTAYTAVMGHLGSDAAAANSIAAVVRDLMCCITNGISAAAGIIVGNELGAGRLETGKLFGDRLGIISVIVGLLSMALVMAVTIPVVNSVILSDTARGYLTGMMIIMAVYMIGRAINTIVINGIFSAGGDTIFDMYSLAVSMWCIALPLAFLGAFVFHWNILLVYGCTCVDEVGKLPWVLHHYLKYKWVKDLTRISG